MQKKAAKAAFFCKPAASWLDQGIISVACPANPTFTIPPHEQTHMEVSFSAGLPAINTDGEPGIQGDMVIGRQAAGVGVPIAAEVAAITAGLPGAKHVGNGLMFTYGL